MSGQCLSTRRMRLKLLPEALVRDELLRREDLESLGTAKKKHGAVNTRNGARCQNRICSGAFCPSTETCLTESCYQRRWCWWQSLFFCLSATTGHPFQTKAFDIAATFRRFAQPSRRCMMWWLPNLGGFHGATANGGRVVLTLASSRP